MDNWHELGWVADNSPRWSRRPAKLEILQVLAAAEELVESTPYRISLRFVFYGLWQSGLFSHVNLTPTDEFKGRSKKAKAYDWWKGLKSKAVRSGIWSPDFLVDDTRAGVLDPDAEQGAEDWLKALQERGIRCQLDKWIEQENRVIVAFEARDMGGQFEHYCAPFFVDLFPLGGHPSQDLKADIAKRMMELDDGRPIYVLYFGDYDEGGLNIPEYTFRDIRQWYPIEFTAWRVALEQHHVAEFDLPDNPSKPGAYEWQSLTHEQAGQIIVPALESLIDTELIDEVQKEEERVEDFMLEALGKMEI